MNFKSTQLLTAAIFFFALIFLLLLLTLLLSSKNQTNEKVSAYECGFEPFSDARHNFQIHFYVVAILFIIFDVEIVFLIPWVLTVSLTGFHGIFSMLIFLFLFFIGFIYEWNSKIINWAWFLSEF